MRAFALTCETVADLDGVEAKVRCAAAHLLTREGEQLPVTARFLAGTPLPPGARAPNVGGATIAKVVAERCGIPAATLRRRAVAVGDLGTAVAAALEAAGENAGSGLSVTEAARRIADLGGHGSAARARLLRRLYASLDPLEAKYMTKLLLGSLRIGMQAGRVEEVIGLAFRAPPEAVRRAHMLLGDIGLVAERAAACELESVRLRAFRPVRCMLAHPVDDVGAVIGEDEAPRFLESKLDGIRAQLHVDGRRHALYSRSLEDVTHWFPEIGEAARRLDGEWILDGEIVAWDDAPLPFALLQQRLGGRQVPLTMLLDVPVVYHAFDVLRAGGIDLLDEPLSRRREVLERLPHVGAVRRLPYEIVSDAEAVADALDAAAGAGHEGVVVKDPASSYRPGTRGRDWRKLKHAVETLSVVVTAAQYGHGKRAGWLSDLTFAVRDGEGAPVEVGKAYSGLTDAEILRLTEHFKATTRRRAGDTHEVEPTVFLEVAFSGIQRSDRHASGFALRFPRIARLREDLGIGDIDDLARLEELVGGEGTKSRDGS